MTRSTDTATRYNDAHLSGWAYVNEVRVVTPRQGKPYLSLALKILQGTREAPSYLYFRSGNAVGDQAIAMAQALQELSEQRHPGSTRARYRGKRLGVFAYVKISDVELDVYTGTKDGEPRAYARGRLFVLRHVHVERVRMFEDLERDHPPLGESERPTERVLPERDEPSESAGPLDDGPGFPTVMTPDTPVVITYGVSLPS